jgi:hypothetical protein
LQPQKNSGPQEAFPAHSPSSFLKMKLQQIAVRAKKVVICARGLNSREIVGARRKALWVSRETRTRLGTFPGTRVTVGVHIAKAKELWTTVSAFEAFTSIILESSVAANLTEIAVRAKKVVICARGLNSRKFPGARCRDTRTGFATFHHAASFHALLQGSFFS